MPLKLPWPVGVKLTVPPGLDAPVPAVSVTVTVTVLGLPAVTEVGLRATEVEVLRAVMLNAVLVAPASPELPAARV